MKDKANTFNFKPSSCSQRYSASVSPETSKYRATCADKRGPFAERRIIDIQITVTCGTISTKPNPPAMRFGKKVL